MVLRSLQYSKFNFMMIPLSSTGVRKKLTPYAGSSVELVAYSRIVVKDFIQSLFEKTYDRR